MSKSYQKNIITERKGREIYDVQEVCDHLDLMPDEASYVYDEIIKENF